MTTTRRWLFGDQLGPYYLDAPDQPALIIESRKVFARRRFHRQKAHLILSAMRHRAAELGEQCRYVRADTYRQALEQIDEPLSVCHPTSHAALDFVRSLEGVEILDARGYATSMADFARWADGRGGKRLLMEDFYRDSRRRLDVLMDGAEPAGGRWNFDADNREPPPKAPSLGLDEPWFPDEDEIDEQVRADLDRWAGDGDVQFLGDDGPRRFAASRVEAQAALERFVGSRLATFGAHEDAMLSGDAWMSHSMLSAVQNLGLLDPVEIVRRAEAAYRSGDAPIASVEGFVRQVMGWRDYVWHLYWYQPRDYRQGNALGATKDLPRWFAELDHERVGAACLSDTLGKLARDGWVHHIPRLMVLGNYAMQRGWRPSQVTDWFHRAFVDGYDWVMVPNVVGMSQYADGGVMATKPYAGGGAYIDRMSDYCGGCRYNPKVRVGEDACPFTAGYWAFLERNREKLQGNFRMGQPLRGLDRLKDLAAVVEQEQHRGSRAPWSDPGDLDGSDDPGAVSDPDDVAGTLDARLAVVAAAIVRDGRVLAARRSRPAALAGRWEFPGGKVEPGEDGAAALARECQEELGVRISVGPVLGSASDARLVLTLFSATVAAGTPEPGDSHDELRWLSAATLASVDWLPLDVDLLDGVRGLVR